MDNKEEITFYRSMEERIQKIENSTSGMKEKMDKLYNHLLGDDDLKTEGVLKSIPRMQAEIDELKAFKSKVQDRAVWTMGIMAIIATAFGWILNKAIDVLFSK